MGENAPPVAVAAIGWLGFLAGSQFEHLRALLRWAFLP